MDYDYLFAGATCFAIGALFGLILGVALALAARQFVEGLEQQHGMGCNHNCRQGRDCTCGDRGCA